MSLVTYKLYAIYFILVIHNYMFIKYNYMFMLFLVIKRPEKRFFSSSFFVFHFQTRGRRKEEEEGRHELVKWRKGVAPRCVSGEIYIHTLSLFFQKYSVTQM